MDNQQIQVWKEKAAANQQTFSCYFADRQWDGLEKSLNDFQINLQVKLSNALYIKTFLKCTIEEQNVINATASKIIELSGTTEILHLSYTYIFTLTEDFKESTAVVLRTDGGTHNEDIFILEPQPNGRVYRGWSDYVASNKLPPCHMCYPKDGFYKQENGRVLIEFQKSPSCNYTFQLLDYVSSGSKTVSCTLLATSMFFPVISVPVVTIGSSVIFTTTAAYTATRNIYDLYDRGTHHQSISPTDEEARSLWLNAATNISGAAVGINSFRILKYAFYALNGFGILNTILTISMKFINGDLQAADMDCFMQMCFFIGNIMITPGMAEEVIATLNNQPKRLKNMFNMVKNTTFSAVKGVINNIVLSNIIEILTGPALQAGLRVINLERTAQFLFKVNVVIHQYENNEIGIGDVFLKLLGDRRLLFDFVNELKNALRNIEMWFNAFWENIRINYTCIFKDTSRVLAVDINANINSMIDSLNVDNRNETYFKEVLLRIATEFATHVNCNTDIEFAEICSFLADKITLECNKKLIVLASKSKLAFTDEFLTFHSVTDNISSNHAAMAEEYDTIIRNTINHNNSYLKSPVYQTDAGEMYIFSQNASVKVFDQFIHDTACELLNVDNIFLKGKFYYSGNEDFNLFIIGYETKSLIFYYTSDKFIKCVLGLVCYLHE